MNSACAVFFFFFRARVFSLASHACARVHWTLARAVVGGAFPIAKRRCVALSPLVSRSRKTIRIFRIKFRKIKKKKLSLIIIINKIERRRKKKCLQKYTPLLLLLKKNLVRKKKNRNRTYTRDDLPPNGRLLGDWIAAPATRWAAVAALLDGDDDVAKFTRAAEHTGSVPAALELPATASSVGFFFRCPRNHRNPPPLLPHGNSSPPLLLLAAPLPSEPVVFIASSRRRPYSVWPIYI